MRNNITSWIKVGSAISEEFQVARVLLILREIVRNKYETTLIYEKTL